MKFVKKLFAVICMVIIIAALSVSAFAKVGSAFYYDGSEEGYRQFVASNVSEEYVKEQFKLWAKLNKEIVNNKEIDFDVTQFEMDELKVDLTKPVWWSEDWTVEQVAQLFDAKDKLSFLHQTLDAKQRQVFYAPIYYKGKFYSYAHEITYTATKNEYAITSPNMYDKDCDIILEDRLLATLQECGLSDWTPQHIFSMATTYTTFVLCTKGEETIAVYLSDTYMNTYHKDYDARFCEQRTFDKEQFVKAMSAYDAEIKKVIEANKNKPINPGGGDGAENTATTVTEGDAGKDVGDTVDPEDDAPQAPWLWIGIVGGAVALVTLILVFVLKKKKA